LETSLTKSLSTWMICSFGLGDLALGLRRRRCLRRAPGEPRRVAPPRGQAGDLHQMLLIELATPTNSVFTSSISLVLGFLLGLEAGDSSLAG